MNVKGTVLSVNGNEAYVRTFKESSCSGCMSCANKAGCDAHFMLFDAPDNYDCIAVNKVGAKVGDTVELYTPTKFSLSLAIAIFLLPVLLTVAAYIISDIFINGYMTVIYALITFFSAFFICSFAANRFSARRITVTICKIIEENGNTAV